MQMDSINQVEALKLIHERFSQGKQASLLVTGTSMVPFLRHRKDWVRLSPVVDVPRRGQILLFRVGERLLLHRLRQKRNGYYYMNGDGQARMEKILPEQVVAVVTHIVRRSGRVIDCSGGLFRGLSWLWWPTRPLRSHLLPFAEGVRKRILRNGNGGTA